ncbi:MAG: DNA replication and repair protein RecF, partial [Clostridia bacterium]|nr:DNA replication and repair protein RecF [Clostridia bacterium]
MRVKNLTLENFRNYRKERFCFGDGVNVIVGDNGQGKTNCVEAVFLLATGYSPRVRRDKQVILYGEKKAEISAVASGLCGDVSVSLSYYDGENKKIMINGVETKKAGEIFGNIYAVYFSPQELKLIQEAPEDRRRFIDIAISQISAKYFYALVKYKKIIEQRNKLLKNPDVDMVLDTLPVWDAQLAEYFADIVIARADYIEKLSPKARQAHLFITDGKERLDVSGMSGYFGSRADAVRDIKLDLANAYRQDMALGFTSIGPHRDDIKITL